MDKCDAVIKIVREDLESLPPDWICKCGHESEAHCRETAWVDNKTVPAQDTKRGLGSCGWLNHEAKQFCGCGVFRHPKYDDCYNSDPRMLSSAV